MLLILYLDSSDVRLRIQVNRRVGTVCKPSFEGRLFQIQVNSLLQTEVLITFKCAEPLCLDFDTVV